MMELIERIEHDDLYRFVRNWSFETVERWIFTNGETDPTGPRVQFHLSSWGSNNSTGHPTIRKEDGWILKAYENDEKLVPLELGADDSMIWWFKRKLMEYLPAKMGSWSPMHRLNRFTATESWNLNPWLDPEVYWGVQFQLSLKQVWECWCFVELRTSIWRQLSES